MWYSRRQKTSLFKDTYMIKQAVIMSGVGFVVYRKAELLKQKD